MSLKIFIVEDHPVMGYTLSHFIQKKLSFERCGVATTGAEALERLAEVEADLINLHLPGMNGFELVEQLRASYPELLGLVLSGHGETIHIQQVFRVGVGLPLEGKPA